ncbi:MAG TPA: hypothetical protein VF885_13625 [Arthrobacter sp.]
MPAKPKKFYVAGFDARQWTGRPAKGAGALFFGAGFLTFLACLFLMIFTPPLRNFIVLVGVCTAVALVSTVSSIVLTAKRESRILADLTGHVNAAILELTGVPSARVPAADVQGLIQDNRRRIPLHINGVPGLQLAGVPGKENEATHVVALLTTPEYGLESFDVLLNAELQRKP